MFMKLSEGIIKINVYLSFQLWFILGEVYLLFLPANYGNINVGIDDVFATGVAAEQDDCCSGKFLL